MAIGRRTIATGALCGAFITIALISFAAALIGRIRPAAPPDDL